VDVSKDVLTFPIAPNESHTEIFNLKSNQNAQLVFKLKTNNPRRYFVKPNAGILRPKESIQIAIRFEPVPSVSGEILDSKDKFLLQVAKVPPNATDLASPTLWDSIDKEQIYTRRLKSVVQDKSTIASSPITTLTAPVSATSETGASKTTATSVPESDFKPTRSITSETSRGVDLLGPLDDPLLDTPPVVPQASTSRSVSSKSRQRSTRRADVPADLVESESVIQLQKQVKDILLDQESLSKSNAETRDEIKRLEEQVLSTSSSVEQLKSKKDGVTHDELLSVRSDVSAEIGSRITPVEKQLEILSIPKEDKTESVVNECKQYSDELVRGLGSDVDRKISAITVVLKGNDEKMNAFENRMTSMENEVKRIGEKSVDTALLLEDIHVLKDQLLTSKSELDSLVHRVSSLEASLSTSRDFESQSVDESQISKDLKDAIDALQARIVTLEQSASSKPNEERIAELEDSVKTSLKLCETLQAAQSELKESTVQATRSGVPPPEAAPSPMNAFLLTLIAILLAINLSFYFRS